MAVFKLVRFSRLLKMNWHFAAKAILGKNGTHLPHSIAPSLWIICVTYGVRVTTSPLKFDGAYVLCLPALQFKYSRVVVRDLSGADVVQSEGEVDGPSVSFSFSRGWEESCHCAVFWAHCFLPGVIIFEQRLAFGVCCSACCIGSHEVVARPSPNCSNLTMRSNHAS